MQSTETDTCDRAGQDIIGKKDVYETLSLEFSNLANLNLRSEEAMKKRSRGVYYAQFSPVVGERLLSYNMSRAWADWHCLS